MVQGQDNKRPNQQNLVSLRNKKRDAAIALKRQQLIGDGEGPKGGDEGPKTDIQLPAGIDLQTLTIE